MKINLTITLTDAEYETVDSIADLESFVAQVIKGEIEPEQTFDHYVRKEIDFNGAKIIFNCQTPF